MHYIEYVLTFKVERLGLIIVIIMVKHFKMVKVVIMFL